VGDDKALEWASWSKASIPQDIERALKVGGMRRGITRETGDDSDERQLDIDDAPPQSPPAWAALLRG
jgi:hypothetical protein